MFQDWVETWKDLYVKHVLPQVWRSSWKLWQSFQYIILLNCILSFWDFKAKKQKVDDSKLETDFLNLYGKKLNQQKNFNSNKKVWENATVSILYFIIN